MDSFQHSHEFLDEVEIESEDDLFSNLEAEEDKDFDSALYVDIHYMC